MSGTVFIEAQATEQSLPDVDFVLTNPAMPGLVKIGRTTTDLATRLRQLDTTGVPLPFECIYAAYVADSAFVEKQIHMAFCDHRIRQSREFFRLSPDRVRAALALAKGTEVTPKGDVVQSADDQRALDRERKRRSNFSFSAIGIQPGSILTSEFDEGLTCTVVDDRRIQFEGQVTSLSASAVTISQRKGRSATSLNGVLYWAYEGWTLDEIRNALIAGDGDGEQALQ